MGDFLKPSFIVRLRRLSELTGNSQGALAAELLDGCVPAIDRLIALLEAAKGAKADVLDKLQADLEAAQGRVEAQLGIALDDSDTLTQSLLDQAEAIPRRGGRSAARPQAKRGARTNVQPSLAVLTPPSNRGVRSTVNKTKVLVR